MADVQPFRGIRFNEKIVGDLGNVVAPPYDVISKAQQLYYYERHPYNIIRLELTLEEPNDNELNNKYTRAARDFRNWLESGVLVYDNAPAFYLHEQDFDLDGERKTRVAFICRVRLKKDGRREVLPHEDTLPKPIEDRLRLLSACKANFSPIFGIYWDPENMVTEALRHGTRATKPVEEFVDDSGSCHRLWACYDPAVIAKVQAIMSSKPIYIADGHHRYETAMKFWEEMSSRGFTGYDSVMTALVNVFDPGLVILPTYRLVRNLRKKSITEVLAALELKYTVRRYNLNGVVNEFISALKAHAGVRTAFGMYAGQGNGFLITSNEHLPVIREVSQLDTSILHSQLIEGVLGLTRAEAKDQANVAYTRDLNYAISAVDRGEYDLGFFLNPTRVEDVISAASKGERMPQKSTYFYPKFITGLVINKLGS